MKRAQRTSSGDPAQQVNDSDDALVKTWTDFFGKWGYKEQQAKDIEQAMNELLV